MSIAANTITRMRVRAASAMVLNTAPKKSLLALLTLLFSCSSLGQNDQEQVDNTSYRLLEELVILGSAEDRAKLPGSAYLVDQEALEDFDYTDLNRVLTSVPGLYIRTEDGFGLRPNIGIRGATSDRSQKVTLMEDRILIAPAPYSAPAAYYIPNVNRMSSVEVVKGPATIQYGPHTVGGAINFVTPAAPDDRVGELDVTLGSHTFQKQRLLYGDVKGPISFWVEGLRFASDGFKTIDGGGDTGFTRQDINGKIRWQGSSKYNQSIEVKLGYADEDSNETYLGLTDTDFRADPHRRYVASGLDNFTSEHTQMHAIYRMDLTEDLALSTRAYVNRFDRAWLRFNGFIGGQSSGDFALGVGIDNILARPDIFTREIGIIRGEIDSNGSPAETLHLTNNDRSYGSNGIQFDLNYQFGLAATDHELEFGVRYHHDYVDRLHSRYGYDMQAAQMVSNGQLYTPTTNNRAETDAIAVYLSDKITYGDWQLVLGARMESIDNQLLNRLDEDSVSQRDDRVVTPSFGLTYSLNDAWTFIAGAYKGFSPAGAAASNDVSPEESTSFEYGVRYAAADLSVDVIGFFTDYDNLIGRCRASDAGCEVGQEFNGGQVEISGLELLAGYHFDYGNYDIPLSLSFTHTDTAFQQRFDSGFSQWGNVQPGDELPYVPTNVARFEAGLNANKWSLNLAAVYTDDTRELPGQGTIAADELIAAQWILDASAQYQYSDRLSLMLAVDNLLDEQNIVARRPFGARPSKPLSFNATVSYRL